MFKPYAWYLWVAKSKTKSRLLWAMIWLSRVAMILFYVMLDIRSICFQKYKNKIKFLNDMKFPSKAIWVTSLKRLSTYATCFLIELCQIVVTLRESPTLLSRGCQEEREREKESWGAIHWSGGATLAPPGTCVNFEHSVLERWERREGVEKLCLWVHLNPWWGARWCYTSDWIWLS